uniref:Putative conserved secreted protein n=1 Tax=Culex tarsalis TaxID=7177 RepID=A0A1Q3FPR3_CULTA
MNRLLLGAFVVATMFKSATAIECYVCNATDSSTPFQCSEWFERFDTPDIKPQDCSNVYGAKYCIKHIGRFEGGIGAKRYCSSRDLGNYCNYVRNPGDQIEYRSCIYTCDTDGCNGAQRATTLSAVALLVAVCATWMAAARL